MARRLSEKRRQRARRRIEHVIDECAALLRAGWVVTRTGFRARGTIRVMDAGWQAVSA